MKKKTIARGRPSLTGKPEPTPGFLLRLTPEMRKDIEARADTRNLTLSAFVRLVLVEHLEGKAS